MNTALRGKRGINKMPEVRPPVPPPQDREKPESSIFPVSKEAADRALVDISRDPDNALVLEGLELQRKNPQLNNVLHTYISILADGSKHFIEGALQTHKILRESAVETGRALPIVSESASIASLRSQMELYKGTSVDDATYIQAEMDKISAEDPVFGDAVKVLTKYRPGRYWFNRGVVAIYLPLKRVSEAQQMSKKFRLE